MDEKSFRKTLRHIGLGDTLASIIHRATFGKVHPCSSCQKRRELLNDLFPYKEKKDEHDEASGDSGSGLQS